MALTFSLLLGMCYYVFLEQSVVLLCPLYFSDFNNRTPLFAIKHAQQYLIAGRRLNSFDTTLYDY